ncbi:hypothetical protein DPEC_G00351850 [Dallia pectoralis]|uniref:Uncharacterized protein n=1 Tax=Dallia pectoralis TaxID=75939 RepID=A0ACC2F288_DALPE|nr:hypothetical protein DPEC_G00351850 [Dallia pectoralis]
MSSSLMLVICFIFIAVNFSQSVGKVRMNSHNLLPPTTFGQNTATFKSKRHEGTALEPGDPAPAFNVPTLDGEFMYPPPAGLKGPVIIHAFTNKSAFLECLWNTESSLIDLVQDLPESTEVLFVSFDDSSVCDALWMRDQVQRAALHRKKQVLSRLHFSPVPVFALGNWIPSVMYSWACSGHNCGLSQVVFTSAGWNMPVIVKRLDARYDWLMGHWSQKQHRLVDAGDACEPSPSVAEAVAWVSEGNCSFFTKVKNMALSKATGVLVYARSGNPIQDMNCVGDECSTPLGLPAAMVPREPSVIQALRFGQQVNVSFQSTPSPNFFIGIDQQGALSEMGWFLYPSFKFINWQAQWFDFSQRLHTRLCEPALMVSVFEKVQMHGEDGAVATVDLPSDVQGFDVLELDASLSCPSRRDESCAPWDHTVQLFVCCDQSSTYCNLELGRWVTSFRRGIGHWLTDVSPLRPLFDTGRCTFTMKTVPWAKPWVVSLSLRFTKSKANVSDSLQPVMLMSLYNGGTFDKEYNKRFEPIKFTVPESTKKVELYAVITGHGSDNDGCGEFCVTSHHFLINGTFNNTRVFDSAGSALGCAMRVGEGAVPNEHGTWLYGRGGWCDGLQVDPWRVDITRQVDMSGIEANTLLYFGLFNGQDPNPSQEPGYIVMFSYLVFYK